MQAREGCSDSGSEKGNHCQHHREVDRASHDLVKGMTGQESEVFLSGMINDNQGPTQMEYELGSIAFEVGTTFDPKPSKKKKGNTAKAKRSDILNF
ncbi:hypothetical protein D1007_38447 [Hordeum vulgare]|nr:hypothetical protein D1007_38447 [Hordeum vulgare]